jgi:hypothetical protein
LFTFGSSGVLTGSFQYSGRNSRGRTFISNREEEMGWDKLKVLFVRLGEVVELRVTALNEKLIGSTRLV